MALTVYNQCLKGVSPTIVHPYRVLTASHKQVMLLLPLTLVPSALKNPCAIGVGVIPGPAWTPEAFTLMTSELATTAVIALPLDLLSNVPAGILTSVLAAYKAAHGPEYTGPTA